jgi:hypothetical protein
MLVIVMIMVKMVDYILILFNLLYYDFILFYNLMYNINSILHLDIVIISLINNLLLFIIFI